MRLYPLNAAQLALPFAAAAILGSMTVGSIQAADAKVVQIPAKQPKVLLDVPDDWSVLPIGTNFELRSPDKTSIVIVGIVKRDKSDVEAWHKLANAKMAVFGVKFDPKAAAPAQAAKAAPAKPAKPDLASLGIAAPQAAKPGAALPATPTGDAAAPALAPMTVFSGAPTIALPEQPPAVQTAKDQEAEPAFSMGQFDAAAPTSPAGMVVGAAFLHGATLDGKPVDAQFFNYGLSKDAVFLLQQESTSTDNRAVAIAKSVRRSL